MTDHFIKIDKLHSLLRKSQRILFFTGAGISTESGISDYRSKGGLWDRFHPVTFQEFLSSEEKRREYWNQKKELYHHFHSVQPNAAHYAIKLLQERGFDIRVVTQNIDGLHQMAGIDHGSIIEIHGTNRLTSCLDCPSIISWEETEKMLNQSSSAPRCLNCGGLLKPSTISFGQSLDENVLQNALGASKWCDLVICVGSTLIVEPAASIPKLAKLNGAKMVIINLSETPLDSNADLLFKESASKVFNELTIKLNSVETVDTK